MNIQERDGNTGLMYACSIGNEQVVEVLLEAHYQKRINILFDLMNSRGQTALDCAQTMHREKILKVFSNYAISTDSRFKPTVLKPKREPSSRSRKHITGGRSKRSNVTSTLAASDTEDELEEFGKLVRTMRECAAEVKQLCYDQNISYDSNGKAKTSKSHKTNRQKMENKTLNTPRIEIHPDSENKQNNSVKLDTAATSRASSRSEKKRDAKTRVSNQTISQNVPHLELPSGDVTSCETPVLSDSASVYKKKSKRNTYNSATKHSARFRDFSVDTMFSKGESVQLHSRESTVTHRSATSPAVLESAFRDPWSTYGDPLPGIKNSPSSRDPLYLPPLHAGQGGETNEGVLKPGKAKNLDKDIWQQREGPPASRENPNR